MLQFVAGATFVSHLLQTLAYGSAIDVQKTLFRDQHPAEDVQLVDFGRTLGRPLVC